MHVYYMYLSMYTCIVLYTYMYIYKYSIHTYMHVLLHICTCTYMYTYMYLLHTYNMYIHVHTYMYLHTIYIHTVQCTYMNTSRIYKCNTCVCIDRQTDRHTTRTEREGYLLRLRSFYLFGWLNYSCHIEYITMIIIQIANCHPGSRCLINLNYFRIYEYWEREREKGVKFSESLLVITVMLYIKNIHKYRQKRTRHSHTNRYKHTRHSHTNRHKHTRHSHTNTHDTVTQTQTCPHTNTHDTAYTDTPPFEML